MHLRASAAPRQIQRCGGNAENSVAGIDPPAHSILLRAGNWGFRVVRDRYASCSSPLHANSRNPSPHGEFARKHGWIHGLCAGGGERRGEGELRGLAALRTKRSKTYRGA